MAGRRCHHLLGTCVPHGHSRASEVFHRQAGQHSLCRRRGGISKPLKVMGVVVQGDCIFSGQEQVMIALINHAVLMGCIPVAGDPWQSYLGAAGWTRQDLGENSLRDLYESGEADAKVAVAAAESLGKRVAQTALLIKAGGAACSDMLAADGAYGLFLSRLQSRGPQPG